MFGNAWRNLAIFNSTIWSHCSAACTEQQQRNKNIFRRLSRLQSFILIDPKNVALHRLLCSAHLSRGKELQKAGKVSAWAAKTAHRRQHALPLEDWQPPPCHKRSCRAVRAHRRDLPGVEADHFCGRL